VTLTADLECAGRGLSLANDAVLDCGGHAIRGVDVPDLRARYGVVIDRRSGAEVRNCRITGFQSGIRLRGGSGNHVTANELVDNRWGIEVAGNVGAGRATGHRIEGNIIRASRMDGIHLGTGSHEIIVVNNDIDGSGQENVILVESTGCLVAGNVLTGGRAGALYVKHSRESFFIANRVANRAIQVVGDSVDNVFAENEVHAAAVIFQALEGSSPARNVVVGGSVLEDPYCFRFLGARDQRVSRVLAHGCHLAEETSWEGLESTGNVVDAIVVTEDFDADGTPNAEDPCTDTDGDGFGDPGFIANECATDNCREVANPEQEDTDGDGAGDACDGCPLDFDPDHRDADGDGIGDACVDCTVAADGSVCNDRSVCTQHDACNGGECTGAAIDCDDADPCTDDLCDAETGCFQVLNDAPCDDANPCTRGDACVAGTCVGGAPVDCPAPDQCQVGVCDPTIGDCTVRPTADGVPCDDGNACTVRDACAGGVCRGGAPLRCDDQDECTTDGCEPGSGCRHDPLGIDAVEAAFGADLGAAACQGERLPRKTRRALRRAVRRVERATVSSSRKAARSLDKASRLIGQAARAMRRRGANRLSPACVESVLAGLLTTNVRTLCVAASLAGQP
jgi:hypothetical protein